MIDEVHPASFRDPSGFLFRKDGDLLRQVNRRLPGAIRRADGLRLV